MKILLLAPAFLESGGIGQYLRMFAQTVLDLGHTAEVVSLREPEWRYADVPDPQVVVAYCGGDKHAFLRAAWRSRRRCDLVVAGHVSLAPIAWAMRRPYIVICYGIDVFTRLPFIRHYTLSRARRIVCLSGYTAAMLGQSNGIFPPQVTVIHPVVEDWLLEAGKASVGAPRHDPFTLLTVARLDSRERYKGHETVIAALPKVYVALNRPLCYIIVGGGDDEPRLQGLADQVRGPGIQVAFYGPVNHKKLAGLYASCDLFVMPSTREGFGVVYLEAQAFGKPVIAGGGGPEEAMLDTVTGYSTHNQTNYDLVGRIVEIAQDDAKRIAMGKAGREWIEEHFTMTQFRNQVMQLLDK